ncbi:hypothetical protein [Streptomyces sp. NPDC091416]
MRDLVAFISVLVTGVVLVTLSPGMSSGEAVIGMAALYGAWKGVPASNRS